METANNYWKQGTAILVLCLTLILMALIVVSAASATNSESNMDRVLPLPTATPIVITESIEVVTNEVVTTTVVVSETIFVNVPTVVTSTEVVTETITLTGTLQGTVTLTNTVVTTNTNIISNTVIMSGTQVITRLETTTTTTPVTSIQIITSTVPNTGSLQGNIWHDLNNSQDASLSEGDMPFSTVIVRLTGSNGLTAETATNSQGEYSFDGLPLDATYLVQVDIDSLPTDKLGATLTYDPDALQSSAFVAELTVEQTDVDEIDFSYVLGDYGDLPNSYLTIDSTGAFHAAAPEGLRITLGSGITLDENGQPNAAAEDDEDDGITLSQGRFAAGEPRTINITAGGAIPTDGAPLGVWIDWNHDGTFSEDEFTPAMVTEGANELIVTPPADYVMDNLSMRYRIFSPDSIPGGTLDWTDFGGATINGEVEDYRFSSATAVTTRDMASYSATPLLLLATVIVLMTVTATIRTARRN